MFPGSFRIILITAHPEATIGDREIIALSPTGEAPCQKLSRVQLVRSVMGRWNFLLAEAGGRKFHCLYCDGEDPLRSPDIAKLFTGELRPLDWSTGTETSKAASGPSLEKGEGHDLD